MIGYSFRDLARDVLESTKRPMSAEQIWDEANALGIAAKVGSRGKTPWRSIQAQLYTDIKDGAEAAYADYLADIRHAALPQSDLLAYATALCDRTAKAAAVPAIDTYPHCKDADTPQLMALLAHLRDTQASISVLQSRYRNKETTLAESSRLRMELMKAEHVRDGIATEIKEKCRG